MFRIMYNEQQQKLNIGTYNQGSFLDDVFGWVECV